MAGQNQEQGNNWCLDANRCGRLNVLRVQGRNHHEHFDSNRYTVRCLQKVLDEEVPHLSESKEQPHVYIGVSHEEHDSGDLNAHLRSRVRKHLETKAMPGHKLCLKVIAEARWHKHVNVVYTNPTDIRITRQRRELIIGDYETALIDFCNSERHWCVVNQSFGGEGLPALRERDTPVVYVCCWKPNDMNSRSELPSTCAKLPHFKQ